MQYARHPRVIIRNKLSIAQRVSAENNLAHVFVL